MGGNRLRDFHDLQQGNLKSFDMSNYFKIFDKNVDFAVRKIIND